MANVEHRVSPRTGVVVHVTRWRQDGRSRQETFPDEKAAEEFRRLVEKIGGEAACKVLLARRNQTVGVPTLREYTERYLDPSSGLLTGIEPGSRKGYEQIARNSFLPILGDYPIDAITKADVGRWVGWQEQQKSRRQKDRMIAPKTVRNYHALLSSIFTSAIEEGHRTDNPAHKTRLTRGVKHEGVYLSKEELSTLLYFIPARYEGLVVFLAGTGCRWGEATALTWGDLTPAQPPSFEAPHGIPAYVRITKAWKKSAGGGPVLKQPKSARGQRTVSLPPDVVQALGKPGPPNQLIFRGELSGEHLWYSHTRGRVWEPAVDKAMDLELCAAEGLTPITRRPTIHDLRHTHASALIARGVPLTEVQVRLGHENISTTSGVYGHVAPAAHIRMAELSGDMLSGTRHMRPLELTE